MTVRKWTTLNGHLSCQFVMTSQEFFGFDARVCLLALKVLQLRTPERLPGALA